MNSTSARMSARITSSVRPPPGSGLPPCARSCAAISSGWRSPSALTAASFWALDEHVIYGPGIVMALIVFGLAQVGVHLVFFLHLTTSPDNTNNALALAFGVLIVSLIFFGSIWVMYHMNQNMIPMATARNARH